MPKRKPSRKKKTQNRFGNKRAKGIKKSTITTKTKKKPMKSMKQKTLTLKYTPLPQLVKFSSLPWVKLKNPNNWVPVTRDISRTLHSDRIFEDGADPTSQCKWVSQTIQGVTPFAIQAPDPTTGPQMKPIPPEDVWYKQSPDSKDVAVTYTPSFNKVFVISEPIPLQPPVTRLFLPAILRSINNFQPKSIL